MAQQEIAINRQGSLCTLHGIHRKGIPAFHASCWVVFSPCHVRWCICTTSASSSWRGVSPLALL